MSESWPGLAPTESEIPSSRPSGRASDVVPHSSGSHAPTCCSSALNPSAKARAWGSLPLRARLSRLDHSGTPSYLEAATPRNVRMYAAIRSVMPDERSRPPGWVHGQRSRVGLASKMGSPGAPAPVHPTGGMEGLHEPVEGVHCLHVAESQVGEDPLSVGFRPGRPKISSCAVADAARRTTLAPPAPSGPAASSGPAAGQVSLIAASAHPMRARAHPHMRSARYG